MRPALIRDIETRSTVDVSDVGAHLYAQHPTTEVLCVGYCLDDGPVKIWHPGEPVPAEFKQAWRDQDYAVAAHNAAFEMQIERHILGPKYGFPIFPVKRNICTMALGLALALPGSLDRIAKVINLEHIKDAVGGRLMLQLARPRRARKSEDPNGVYFFDDTERLSRLDLYCIADVETARELLDTIPELSEHEQQIWILDQKVNDFGIYLDLDLMRAAKKIIDAALPSFDREMTQLTNGRVTAITQVAKLKQWISMFYSIDTLRKNDLEELLGFDDLPDHVRKALELRAQGSHAAVKKVEALLQRRNGDGRLRGAFVYHAAGPGRWSSRGAQVHNLKRSMTKDIDTAIKVISSGSFIKARQKYDNPLSVIGDLIRATITAAPGNVLIGADFSGIEARVTAWVAGEERKLDTFRAYDTGTGPDPYIIAAAAVLNADANEIYRLYKAGDPDAREQRQVGKACELAFGYQGGLNAFKRFLPGSVQLSTPVQSNWDKRHGFGPAGGEAKIVDVEFTDAQIQTIKNAWRRAHPHIAQFWRTLDHAAWKAVKNPGAKIGVLGRLEFEYDEAFLWLTLPSGRKLAYPHARIIRAYVPKGKKIVLENKWGEPAVVFKDASAGQWRDVRVYGGLLTENVVQAISRDLLAEAMLRVDKAGFDIVAHVHDECVIEVTEDKAKYAMAKFDRLMNEVPSWAEGLPIVAKAWTAKRYVK